MENLLPNMSATPQDESRKGKLTIEGDHATIVFTRFFQHPPERVWEAITNPEDLKHWLMCSSAKIEGRVGGSVEMISGPAQFHVQGKVLAWDPPRVYEHEWKVAPVQEMPNGEDAVFRYELTPQGEHTLLTVTYRRLTANTARGFAPGTHVLLDRLEAQLDQQPLPAWMPRFTDLMSLYPAWQK
jgi:uncharacterized protein YndB with AHSA1/START domain